MIKSNIHIPSEVLYRLSSLGEEGKIWLKRLPFLIDELEQKWEFTTTDVLSGGSHAFIANVDLKNGKKAIVKISTPHKTDDGDLPFSNEIAFIKANPQAFAKVFKVDEENQSCLMERCGHTLKDMGFSIQKQLETTCITLQKVWIKPSDKLRQTTINTQGICKLLYNLITYTYPKFPIVSQNTINKTLIAITSRATNIKPANEVMIHGDAHPANILQSLDNPNEFKMIDPDGIISEPAYDMGILMREWTEQLIKNPVIEGKKRASYLNKITGINKQAIWEWGLIQSTASALLCAKVGQKETSDTLGKIANYWVDYVIQEQNVPSAKLLDSSINYKKR